METIPLPQATSEFERELTPQEREAIRNVGEGGFVEADKHHLFSGSHGGASSLSRVDGCHLADVGPLKSLSHDTPVDFDVYSPGDDEEDLGSCTRLLDEYFSGFDAHNLPRFDEGLDQVLVVPHCRLAEKSRLQPALAIITLKSFVHCRHGRCLYQVLLYAVTVSPPKVRVAEDHWSTFFPSLVV